MGLELALVAGVSGVTPDPWQGQQASYRLLSRMQSGGMAEVFRARRLPDGRKVAVKRMLLSLSNQNQFMDMFTDEARIAMGLDHPNIVETLDVGSHEGLPFLVMENVEGVNLRELFQSCAADGARIPVGMVCSMVASICDALSYGHNTPDGKGRPLRVVHRDVSPANILVSNEGQLKLIDFGVAKARDRVARTATGMLKGKISYLSPEQIGGTPADHRADIFSAGAVLWELLTCRRLFDAPTDFKTFELLRECRPARPSSINDLVPRSLDKIVLKALAKDPAERYQDAAELRDALASTTRSLGERWTPDRISDWIRVAMGIDVELIELPQTPKPAQPPKARASSDRARKQRRRSAPPERASRRGRSPGPGRTRPPSGGSKKRRPAAEGKRARPAAPRQAPGGARKQARDARGNPIELSSWGDSTGVIVPPPAGASARPAAAAPRQKPAMPGDQSKRVRTQRVGSSASGRVSSLLVLLTLSLVASAVAAPELWLPLLVS